MSLLAGIVLAATAGLGIAGDQPVVTGSLDKGIIQRVIRAHLNEVKYCYESVLAKQPTLAGKVTVRFAIGGSGAVNRVETLDSSLGNVGVEACLATRIKQWTFPAPAGGGIVTVSYPFVFKTAADPPPAAATPVVVADAEHNVLVPQGRLAYRLAQSAQLTVDLGKILPLGDANAIVVKLGANKYAVPLVTGTTQYVLGASTLEPLGTSPPFAGFVGQPAALLLVVHKRGDKLTELWTANLLFAPRP